MAALWIHDLRNDSSVANPETVLDHPLELMMEGANHGGLWRVAYLARTALPLLPSMALQPRNFHLGNFLKIITLKAQF